MNKKTKILLASVVVINALVAFKVGLNFRHEREIYHMKEEAIREAELEDLTISSQNVIEVWIAEKRKALK